MHGFLPGLSILFRDLWTFNSLVGTTSDSASVRCLPLVKWKKQIEDHIWLGPCSILDLHEQMELPLGGTLISTPELEAKLNGTFDTYKFTKCVDLIIGSSTKVKHNGVHCAITDVQP